MGPGGFGLDFLSSVPDDKFCELPRSLEKAGMLATVSPVEGGLSIMKQLTRITLDPAVMGGKPCIRGLRVTVGTVVGLLAAGRSTAEILQAYPYLEEEDIREALAYAAWRVEEIESLVDHT